MASGFRANALGGNGQTATTASLSIVIPASAVAGDVARLTVESANDTVTLVTPAGWTLLSGPDRVGTNASGWLLVKTLTGGDPGATVTLSFSTAQRCSAQMAVYSGATATGLLFAKRVETATANATTLPSLGSVQANALLDVSWARRFGGTPAPNVTLPAGYSQGGSNRAATSYGSQPELSVEAAYRVVPSAGTYGGETANVSSNSIGVNYVLALRAVVTDVTVTGVAARAVSSAPAGVVSTGLVVIEGTPARVTASAPAGSITGGEFPVEQPPQTWPPEPYREAIRGGLAIWYTVDATLGGQPVFGAQGLRPTGGSITDTNRPGVRRTLSVEFADPTGELYEKLIPSGTRLTVTAHLRYTDRSELEIPMGVFVVDTERLSEGSGQLSITAPDKWWLVQRAKFLKPQASVRGDRIVDQIASLIRGALGQDEAVIINATSQATIAQLTWEQDREQAIIELADQIGAWVSFDRDGVCTIADVPRAGAVANWLIDASASGVLIDIDRELSASDAANVVVVESSASDEKKFETVYVWDADPLSPTYAGPDPVNSPQLAGPFGISAVHESSPNLETPAEAAEFGGAVLARQVGLRSQVSLEDVPNPAIDAYDVIDVLPPGQAPNGATGIDGFGVGAFGESGFGSASLFQVAYRSTREVERHTVDTVTHPFDLGTSQRIEGRSVSVTGPITPEPPTDPTDPTPPPPPPPPPPPTATIFGFNTAESGTFNQTIAGRRAWWGRAPMVRRYYSGMLPATFGQTTAVCPEKRLSISFKSDGSFSAASLATGGGDARLLSWLQDIPDGWTVYLTYHHEPNDEIRNFLTNFDPAKSKLNPTHFVNAYAQFYPVLQAERVRVGGLNDRNVTVKLCANFMAYNLTNTAGSFWADSWVPAEGTMDLLTFDIYGNPGEGGATSSGSNTYGTATGTGYGTKYPLPAVRAQPMFDIIRRTGWAQHWGILEVNTPARSWDTNESSRARWFKDMYDHFLAQPYDPEVVLLWEQVEQSFANWDQSFGRLSGNATPMVNALKPYIQGSP